LLALSTNGVDWHTGLPSRQFGRCPSNLHPPTVARRPCTPALPAISKNSIVHYNNNQPAMSLMGQNPPWGDVGPMFGLPSESGRVANISGRLKSANS
jgi:hypothetical protein